MAAVTVRAKGSDLTEIVIGVDAHKDIHVVVVLSLLGTVLASRSFATTAAGCRSLLTWARTMGRVSRAGVEGTGSYGAGLTRAVCMQLVWRSSRSTVPTGRCVGGAARATPSTQKLPPAPYWVGKRPSCPSVVTVRSRPSGSSRSPRALLPRPASRPSTSSGPCWSTRNQPCGNRWRSWPCPGSSRTAQRCAMTVRDPSRQRS
nr:IS110 family transposase [Streptomyces antibioticus]